MSHLHIPDGLLPVWLWLSGMALAAVMLLVALAMLKSVDLRRKVPLLGMMSAMMLVGMNIEIAPYHVNLSVVTGIILGPWMAVIAAFIVNVLMAMVGHGGVTVLGINSVVIASEGVAGYLLFHLFRKFMPPGAAAGISTVLALFTSTCLMVIVVFLANVDFSASNVGELREAMESPTFGSVANAVGMDEGFNFRLFAIAAFGLGFFGWLIEAFITFVAVRFIAKVKPELVK